MIRYQEDEINSLKGLMPKRVLIVQTAFIGDVVLITALVKECRLLFPEALLDVMLIPSTASVLRNNPYINQILVFDKKKRINFFKIIKRLRKNNYDLVLTPHSSLRTALILRFAGIKYRIGFNRWFSRHFLTHRVNHYVETNKMPHKVEKFLKLLSLFTDKTMAIETELYPNENDYQFSEEVLRHNKDNRKALLIAPGSVWQTKRWNEGYFSKLCSMLLNEGFFIVLSGSKSEYSICHSIYESVGNENKSHIVNVCGKTSLLETAAIISKCNLVLCNDSGTLHIANAMNIPVFAIFGPTVRSFGYFPYRDKDYVFECELPCRPCGSHGGKKCHLKHHNCMNMIMPEIIFNQIISFFN